LLSCPAAREAELAEKGSWPSATGSSKLPSAAIKTYSFYSGGIYVLLLRLFSLLKLLKGGFRYTVKFAIGRNYPVLSLPNQQLWYCLPLLWPVLAARGTRRHKFYLLI